MNRAGEAVSYGRSPTYDLRITSGSIVRFAEHIGFSLPSKAAVLRELVVGRSRGFYEVDRTARLLERTDPSFLSEALKVRLTLTMSVGVCVIPLTPKLRTRAM